MITGMHKKHTIIKWAVSAIILIVFATGCKNEALIRPGDSLATAYKKALRQYQNENYREAATAFQTVINVGRGTDYAQSAQFYLAETYYKDERYLLAANTYQQFTTLYPRSPKRQTAAFKEALSYYHLSPRYRIDQTFTRQAIEKFRIFISRYPESEEADLAAKYLTDMRSKLAHKKFNAAEMYMLTDQYEAATIYYDLVIAEFPETAWAERALVNEIAAYNEYASKSVRTKQYERYQKAVEAYEKYLQLFPNGPNRQAAENHVDVAREALADLNPVVEEQTTSADQ